MSGFFVSRRRPRPNVQVLEECSRLRFVDPSVKRIKASGRGNSSGRRRVGMCAVVFAAAFCVLGAKLTSVSIAGVGQSQKVATKSQKLQDRAEITDRNGALLATNLPMRGLEVVGKEVWDVEETVAKLGDVFPEIDERDLLQKLSKRRYVPLRVKLTPADEEAVFELGLPGIRFNSIVKRYYPQNSVASHLVGHLEDGKRGVMGLEKVLDNKRSRHTQYDNVKVIAASIDIRIQQVLERVLSDGAEKYQAKAAWGGVMDVRTGEVIALASVPDFDPNDPGGFPDGARKNRAIYDRYEFGSAFKVFTAAMALDAKVADEVTPYNARFGSYKVADRVIRDYHGENRMLTLSEVVQHSSNIGAARMAADVGIKGQRAILRQLGMFDALDIPFHEKRTPELPWQWGPVEAATISYGHGIAVTPLHLLTAFGAVVNGGDYRAPSFFAGKNAKVEKVFSADTSFVMRRILRRVITNGTASAAEVPGYFPIGKTATADKPVRGGYDRTNRLSSFIGAFPGHDPQYAILISLDEPKPVEGTFGFATAGWNAAPIFADVTKQIAPILGVMPTGEDDAVRAFVSAEKNDERHVESGEGSIARGSR